MQDSTKTSRGRPRAFDEGAALAQIMGLFWQQGYSATSLDELSAATGMKRPSLYNAFGSKRDMYSRALAHFTSTMSEKATQQLFQEPQLRQALLQFYGCILETYFAEGSDLGCMMFSVAIAETQNLPEIKQALQSAIENIDQALQKRLHIAVESGELPPESDVPGLAILAQAVLQHLAIRARAGASRKSLEAMVMRTVDTLLAVGAEPSG